MAYDQISTVISYIRKIAAPPEPDRDSDEQLLDRFIRRRDEAAFEGLLRRHAPMVLGTCMRVLNNVHDAEDACQATFLVLARKAGSISRRDSVGGWLYRIALRTAVRARMEASRRHSRESPLADMPAAVAVADLAWFELRPVLDEELNRLPGRYRDAVILCYFQAKTYAEAAKTLGLAAGTVSSRLARARDLLRGRLTRRGLALSSGLLATLLSQNALSAPISVAWMNRTAKAALQFVAGKAAADAISIPVLTLAEGMLQTMFVTKLGILTILFLTVGLFGSGAGLLARHLLADKQPIFQKEDAPKQASTTRAPSQAEKTPGPAKSFENEFGYSWQSIPRKFSSPGPDASQLWATPGGVLCTFAESKSGALLVTLAHARQGNKPSITYRPIAFDADRKRYMFCQPTAGGSSNEGVSISMALHTLDSSVLPPEKIRYIGIEALTPEGINTIAARGMRRAKAAGIEVLPPAFNAQVYDFVLTTMDGKKIRAQDLRGKAVLIDCWSTTCLPCMEKMPKLKLLYEKYHKDGFDIIGVSLDLDAKIVKKVCKSRELTWPQVLVPPDDKTREVWYQTAGLSSVPRLLLIDREGILRADCNPDQLEKEITKLMERPTTGR